MVFKFNLSMKNGKTFKLESDSEALDGKEIGQKISGSEISPDLDGYEFEIMGGSDKAGMPMLPNVDGTNLKRVLLGYGKGMHKRSRREGKKKRSNFTPKGLRLRKTVRGKTISLDITQVNLKVLKQGNKSLEEIFPDQCQPKEKSKK
ncbi:30S ribosomal protein S6e [Candidatus Pacearchaeota archaeon]|nr:30S ribosomal protein S6e [Candidatus Pacearchaeota archaeon]